MKNLDLQTTSQWLNLYTIYQIKPYVLLIIKYILVD
jgi:hypothetical protein